MQHGKHLSIEYCSYGIAYLREKLWNCTSVKGQGNVYLKIPPIKRIAKKGDGWGGGTLETFQSDPTMVVRGPAIVK